MIVLPPASPPLAPLGPDLFHGQTGRNASEDADMVRRGFWRTLRQNLRRIPFAKDAVAAYYAAMDPATPARAKAIMFAALAYFVIPADTLPDFIALLGFTDDAAVLALALSTVRAHLRPDHYDRAEAVLSDPGADQAQHSNR